MAMAMAMAMAIFSPKLRPETWNGGTRTRAHIMGERACRCVAWVYPRAFFFPDPAESIPPVYDGGGRRGNNNINNNTMASCRGLLPTIVLRVLPLIRSGGIPLSLIWATTVLNLTFYRGGRGIYHPICH